MMFAKLVRALVIGIAIGLAIGAPTLAQAQQLIGSYVALLSEADHFNSSGQRLTSAAARHHPAGPCQFSSLRHQGSAGRRRRLLRG